MPWEDLKPMFRPTTIHMGVMKADEGKCNSCGLCLENCPFRCWEMDENDIPRMKEQYECFSCYNCLVACPVDAISIVDSYHVDEGFFFTDPYPLPAKLPLEPLDANGNTDKWTEVERTVFERRSVRNYSDRPVPEPLIRRVLEAGRFAPTAGNCQPWKFIVITNKALIDEINDATYNVLSMLYAAYMDDELVKSLVPVYETNPLPGNFDPRVILGGVGSIVRKNAPVFLNAPVVILLVGDQRAISGPQLNIGICGQNMNLVAKALGIGFCWIGFSQTLNMVPPILEKLGIQYPWEITNAAVLGYPRFKQEGVVPREYRPVAWFREGSDIPEIEE